MITLTSDNIKRLSLYHKSAYPYLINLPSIMKGYSTYPSFSTTWLTWKITKIWQNKLSKPFNGEKYNFCDKKRI